jgi:hypothetical protein
LSPSNKIFAMSNNFTFYVMRGASKRHHVILRITRRRVSTRIAKGAQASSPMQHAFHLTKALLQVGASRPSKSLIAHRPPAAVARIFQAIIRSARNKIVARRECIRAV